MSQKQHEETSVTKASRIWPILVLAAKNRQTLTYKDMSVLTGIHYRSQSKPLEVIMLYCENNKLPPLTVLVVLKSTGKPSTGLRNVKDFRKAREKVFAHKWECPGTQAFIDIIAK